MQKLLSSKELCQYSTVSLYKSEKIRSLQKTEFPSENTILLNPEYYIPAIVAHKQKHDFWLCQLYPTQV